MLEKGKIGNYQLFLLIIFTILPTAILSVPGVTAGIAKEEGWLATLLATGMGTGMALMVALFYRLFSGRNLLDISSQVLGKWPAKLVGLGYIWFFFHANSIIIREFGEFLTTAVMPETPLSVFNVSIILLAVLAVYQGLEVIGRMSEFVFPLSVAATVTVLVLSLGEVDLSQAAPFVEFKPGEVLAGAMVPASWMGEVIITAMLIPFVQQTRRSGWWIVASIATSGMFLSLITLLATLVFGVTQTSLLVFPTFSLARIISIAKIIERTESLVMAIWVAGVFLKIVIWFYILVLVTAQVFGLKSYKPLVIPFAFAQVALSFWLFGNYMEFVQFIGTTWPVYSLGVFELGIPILIWAVALMRRSWRGAGNEGKS